MKRTYIALAAPALALGLLPSQALADNGSPACQPAPPPTDVKPPADNASSGTSLQTADVVPGVLTKLTPTAANLANLALQVGPAGTQVRGVFMPGYLKQLAYVRGWSDTKITASTDTSTSLTAIAVTIYPVNPFAARGKWAKDRYEVAGTKTNSEQPECRAVAWVRRNKPEPSTLTEKSNELKDLLRDKFKTLDAEAEPVFAKIKEDLQAKIQKLGTLKQPPDAQAEDQIEQARNQIAKIQGDASAIKKFASVSGKDLSDEDLKDIKNLINLADMLKLAALKSSRVQDDVTVIQRVLVGIDVLKYAHDKLTAQQKRTDAEKNAENAEKKLKDPPTSPPPASPPPASPPPASPPPAPVPPEDQLKAEVARLKARADKEDQCVVVSDSDSKISKADAFLDGVEKSCNDESNAEFWHETFSGGVPQWGITVESDFYPLGVGPNPLDKTGTTTAQLEWWGGMRMETSLTFRPHEEFELDVFGQFRYVRPSGMPFTQFAYYEGGGMTLAGLVWPWLDKSKRATDPDYQKSGALPGLSVGASGQFLFCQRFANCINTQISATVPTISAESVTPFIDVKVSNAIQFRLAMPFKFSQGTSAPSFSWAPIFSAASAFAAL